MSFAIKLAASTDTPGDAMRGGFKERELGDAIRAGFMQQETGER